MRVMGKRDLLKQQLLDLQVHVADLQETRLAQTALLPDKEFLMFHSSSTEKGHCGMGLWINRVLPFATFRGEKQCFVKENFTLLE